MQMDLGTVATLMGVFATIITGLVRLLLWQFEKRLGERFASQDEARKVASQHWEDNFAKVLQRQDKDADAWEDNFAKVLQRQDKDAEAVAQLERSFLMFKAELPLAYLRREDWSRGQSVIEAKLDGLALRYENILLKGARND